MREITDARESFADFTYLYSLLFARKLFESLRLLYILCAYMKSVKVHERAVEPRDSAPV